MSAPANFRRAERGVTLVELLAAMVVISIGVLALVRLLPAGERNQLNDRMLTTANMYAQEKVEQLSAKGFADSDLSVGRHPATGFEDLGTSQKWHRYYEVTAMPAPLDNLKKITVTVSWTLMGSRSVTATTYTRR